MERKMIALICAGVLVLNINSATANDLAEEAADPIAVSQLDGFALGLAHAGKFSGVLLVAKDGHVLLERAYGKRDERQEDMNTVDTRFNLASAGKMFTAVAILQQVAAGRVSLDSKVGEVLEDYPNREFANKVTVRHLLTHTAGAGGIDLFGVENAANRQRVNSVSEMMTLHADREPSFEPGSNQEYGNFGHVILGRIVEALSGQTFEDYLQVHIFDPVGMTRTGFVDCTESAVDIAVGYVDVDDERKLNCETLPRRGFPAGGEVSTARDMFKFVEALKAGKLLPAPLFEEAIRPQHEFMGLGFFATEYGLGYPARNFRWGHAGSADGICADVRTYPVTGETVIALSNMDVTGCFDVTGFLHRQWEMRDKDGGGAAGLQSLSGVQSGT
jgi:D-alanyl-D-alanine carboxypeptidase